MGVFSRVARLRADVQLVAAAVTATALLLIGSAGAQATVRVATLPAIAAQDTDLDLQSATVTIDNTAGSFLLIGVLRSPAPATEGFGSPKFTLGARASGGACATTPTAGNDTNGDVQLKFGETNDTSQVPVPVTYTAAYRVLPQTATSPATVTISADRLHVTASFTDPALIGAAPRCASVLASNSDSQPIIPARWFDGQAPALKLHFQARPTQHLQPVSAGPTANLRHRVSCSLECAVTVRAKAKSPTHHALAGLTLAATAATAAEKTHIYGYKFTAAQRHLLAAAFTRYGKVIYTLQISALDDYGRTTVIDRQLTLKPTLLAKH